MKLNGITDEIKKGTHMVGTARSLTGLIANTPVSLTSNVQLATVVCMLSASTARSRITYPSRTFWGVPVMAPVCASTAKPMGSLSKGDDVSAPAHVCGRQVVEQ